MPDRHTRLNPVEFPLGSGLRHAVRTADASLLSPAADPLREWNAPRPRFGHGVWIVGTWRRDLYCARPNSMSDRTLRARTAAAYQTSRGSSDRMPAMPSSSASTEAPTGPGMGSAPIDWALAVVEAPINRM
jgi:hypothetical protein